MNLVLITHAFSCWFMAGAIWLTLYYQSNLFIGNFVSVLVLWGLTGLVNVPSHETLRYEVETTKTKLIRNNWPRTILWTMRSVFLVWMIHLSIEGVLK
jgi:hypothetical protein